MPKLKPSPSSGATIITPGELERRPIELPRIWQEAAGLLSDRALDPVKEQRALRLGWAKRWNKQLRLGRNTR